jgi:hypothetical protein
LPLPSVASPTVLGVDDFALRKRQRYGTVLIDLERRQLFGRAPLDLLSRRFVRPSAGEPERSQPTAVAA